MKVQDPLILYRTLFDNMLDGLIYCQLIFNEQGNPIDFIFIKTNKTFEKLTGLKKVEGKKATETIPKIGPLNFNILEIFNRIFLTKKPERFEIYAELFSKWFFVSVYHVKEDLFVIMFQDITDRKQMEKNLENAKIAAKNVLEDLSIEKSKMEMAKAKEEAILLSIGDGLIATDEKGNIMFINKTAEKMLDKKNEEVKGKIFSEITLTKGEKETFIPLEKHPLSMALATGAVTSTSTMGSTCYYMWKDKEKFPVAIMVTPVILGGKVIGAIEVFRDISREKEIDKAKSEFVSLASHQLRTPTTAIKWYSEMLLEEDSVFSEKQKEYLKEIHNGNQRMIDLINTLLNVPRIESSTFTIQFEPMDITVVADDVLKELQNQIDSKNLEIKKEYKKDVPVIKSDQKLIRIIMQNLLSNAVSYTPPKGKISIEIKKTNMGVNVEVEDSGYGIPQSEQSKMYTKFFRADNVRSVKPEGTGLGLYITKAITEALGGTINFKSKEGEGTTFYVNIPG